MKAGVWFLRRVWYGAPFVPFSWRIVCILYGDTYFNISVCVVGSCVPHDSNVQGRHTVRQVSAGVTSQGMVHASKRTGMLWKKRHASYNKLEIGHSL